MGEICYKTEKRELAGAGNFILFDYTIVRCRWSVVRCSRGHFSFATDDRQRTLTVSRPEKNHFFCGLRVSKQSVWN
jgi:hypothetical protein